MSPEDITLPQILGALTLKNIIAIASAALAAGSAVAYGGYWVGQQIADSRSLVQQAELKAVNSQVQAKLEVTQSQLQASVATATHMKELLERLQKTVEDKSNEVAKLNDALGRSNNCTFIQQQIIDTKREMQSTGSGVVFSKEAEWQEKQKIRKALLEQRLAGYQNQLSGCNK